MRSCSGPTGGPAHGIPRQHWLPPHGLWCPPQGHSLDGRTQAPLAPQDEAPLEVTPPPPPAEQEGLAQLLER